MHATALSQQLRDAYRLFMNEVNMLPETPAGQQPIGKWNAEQLLQHLILSVKPVLWGCKMPGLVLRLLFGRHNGPSVGYDELVARYRQQLAAAGGKAPVFFHPPKNIQPGQRQHLGQLLERVVAQLADHLVTTSEKQLDSRRLPHPLLGKITLREMAYFTMYHAHHHREQLGR